MSATVAFILIAGRTDAFGENVFDGHRGGTGPTARGGGHRTSSRSEHSRPWAEQKAVREIMVFLHSQGVGMARAVRIFKTYGADAIQVMTENPYRLACSDRDHG